jgi:nitrate reductase (NAD(P)H)
MLEEFKIGEMTEPLAAAVSDMLGDCCCPDDRAVATAAGMLALNLSRVIAIKLAFKESLTHDIQLLRFDLPSEKHVLGLPVGKYLHISATVDGKPCSRAYTPVSSDRDLGYVDLLVKVYLRGSHPEFPDGGLMSQHLSNLQVGESVEMRGPFGHIEYIGSGRYRSQGKEHYMKRCAMVAGGIGITPVYQVIRAIMDDPDDPTEVWLVFANKTPGDIMFRPQLDRWARDRVNFKVWYVVSKASTDSDANADAVADPDFDANADADADDAARWAYSIGWIDEDILRAHLPPAGFPETSVFLCGPLPMMESACVYLDNLGYERARCHRFENRIEIESVYA